MLSLRRPLIKDALTKATLMRKLQLWLQSPNSSLEKSADWGIHYHPPHKGTLGMLGGSVKTEHRDWPISGLFSFHGNPSRNSGSHVKKLLPAGGGIPGNWWILAAVLHSRTHPANVPLQCNPTCSQTDGGAGWGNRAWTLHRRDSTMSRRKSHFVLIQGVDRRQHHALGKGPTLSIWALTTHRASW